MTIVFKVSDNVKEKMIEFYQHSLRPKTPPYAIFQAQDADVIVTLYESGKVMFQGVSADIEANIWKDQEKHLNSRDIDKEIAEKEKKPEEKDEKNKDTYFDISTVGSDEVGTGDYFGPVVVSASYVSKENINFLIDLGVKDSKAITDDKILKMAPIIIKRIPYTTLVLNNIDFNKYTTLGYNMNKIKAILHNKVLYSLLNKENINPEKVVVDQFVYPKKYYEHIKEAQNKISNITFTTKAENKCLSVACASIISRYIFLKEMDKLSDSLNIPLPKGAHDSVDNIGVEIVNKYGFDKLNEIAKINFKNTEKIKNKIN